MRDEKEYWKLEKEEAENKLKEITGLSQKYLFEQMNESAMKKMIDQSHNLDIYKINERFSKPSTLEISKAQEPNEIMRMLSLDKLTEHQRMLTEKNTCLGSQLKKTMGVDSLETLTKIPVPKTMIEEIKNATHGKLQLETNPFSKMLEMDIGRKILSEADKILKENYNTSIKESQKAFDDLFGKNLTFDNQFKENVRIIDNIYGSHDKHESTMQKMMNEVKSFGDTFQKFVGVQLDANITALFTNTLQKQFIDYQQIKQEIDYLKHYNIPNTLDEYKKYDLIIILDKEALLLFVLSGLLPRYINRKMIIKYLKNEKYRRNLTISQLEDLKATFESKITLYLRNLPILDYFDLNELIEEVYNNFSDHSYNDGILLSNVKKWLDISQMNYPIDLPDHTRIIPNSSHKEMHYFIEERTLLIDAYFYKILVNTLGNRSKKKRPDLDLSSINSTICTFSVSAISTFMLTILVFIKSQEKQNKILNSNNYQYTCLFEKVLKAFNVKENGFQKEQINEILEQYSKKIDTKSQNEIHIRLKTLKIDINKFLAINYEYVKYRELRNCIEHFNDQKIDEDKDKVYQNLFINDSSSQRVWSYSRQWIKHVNECSNITIDYLKLYWEFIYGKNETPKYMFNLDEKLITGEAQKKVDVYLKAMR